MGNSSSSHQPLERGFTRGTFGDIKNVVRIKFHRFKQQANIESEERCGFPETSYSTSFHAFYVTQFHFFHPQKSSSFRSSKRSPKKMDRLRKSFRESFRRRKDRVPEASKPHQWQADESAVRSATCVFSVKYLGCVEVFESRGMQVCEEAIKVLRVSKKSINEV